MDTYLSWHHSRIQELHSHLTPQRRQTIRCQVLSRCEGRTGTVADPGSRSEGSGVALWSRPHAPTTLTPAVPTPTPSSSPPTLLPRLPPSSRRWHHLVLVWQEIRLPVPRTLPKNAASDRTAIRCKFLIST